MALPIACIKCVLPKPTPPWRNNGLYEVAGASATARAAAWANLLYPPTTKVSNVYFGFRVGLEFPKLELKLWVLDPFGSSSSFEIIETLQSLLVI